LNQGKFKYHSCLKVIIEKNYEKNKSISSLKSMQQKKDSKTYLKKIRACTYPQISRRFDQDIFGSTKAENTLGINIIKKDEYGFSMVDVKRQM